MQIFRERKKTASRFVCGKLSTYKYVEIFIYKVPSVYRVKLCMNRTITMCYITLIFFVSEKKRSDKYDYNSKQMQHSSSFLSQLLPFLSTS